MGFFGTQHSDSIDFTLPGRASRPDELVRVCCLDFRAGSYFGAGTEAYGCAVSETLCGGTAYLQIKGLRLAVWGRQRMCGSLIVAK